MSEESIDLAALRDAIVRRRKSLGWTTGRLAAKSGVPDPYLRRIESGVTKSMGLGVLQQIATGLGTTVDVLLADAGIPTTRLEQEDADEVYRQLDATTRIAWLRMGRTLKEIQDEYAALQAGADEIEEAQEIALLRAAARASINAKKIESGATRETVPDDGTVDLDILDVEDRAASQEPRGRDDEGNAD